MQPAERALAADQATLDADHLSPASASRAEASSPPGPEPEHHHVDVPVAVHAPTLPNGCGGLAWIQAQRERCRARAKQNSP